MFSQKFPHRHNPDGTHDSICTRCLATIATVTVETDLALHESGHVCHPMNLHRMTEDYTVGSALAL
jgi:hypothetical protein